MLSLPFRQVHLDFHTSEAIPGVGRDWNRAHFQEMLQRGHVSSITLFSKCHHGWNYHETDVALGARHPHLEPGLDLLREQIEAAHEIGVQTPVYISAGLDEKLVAAHTDWLLRTPDGGTKWVGWMEAGWHEFCLRSPYLNYLLEQVREVATRYEFEGLFLDITGVRECCCQTCIAAMREQGLDPRDPDARRALGRDTFLRYAHRVREVMDELKPDARLFHNDGHIARGDEELARTRTHLELESLPTGGWGYDHMPLSARYVAGMGMEYLAQTGKFHTFWGEFGGFKHPNALRYETARMLLMGARCLVGDQMHPNGRLDPTTYALIGAAYREVEAKEAWCADARSVADVGVLSVQAFESDPSLAERSGASDVGAVRVLLEGGVLFDVLDGERDFDAYKVLILPDAVPVAGALRDKLLAYLKRGGKLLVTGHSALDAEKGAFTLPLGARYVGEGKFNPCFISPRFALAPWEDAQGAAFVMYGNAVELEVTDGEVLADRRDPYFNRDFLHFCSHQHAPDTGEAAGAAMVATPQTVYLSLPAFALYAGKGQNVLRELLLFGLRRLLPEPTIETNLPAQGSVAVFRREQAAQTVIHLLYGAPILRGDVQVVEDLPPLFGTRVALRLDGRPERVFLAPQNTDLPFEFQSGVLSVVVPEFSCHQMLVAQGAVPTP